MNMKEFCNLFGVDVDGAEDGLIKLSFRPPSLVNGYVLIGSQDLENIREHAIPSLDPLPHRTFISEDKRNQRQALLIKISDFLRLRRERREANYSAEQLGEAFNFFWGELKAQKKQ